MNDSSPARKVFGAFSMCFSVRSSQYVLLAAVIAVSACIAVAQVQIGAGDSDRDGMSDEFEQALLEKFRPTFLISPTDCAAKPSRFSRGYAQPELEAADGTIYGQVFPVGNDKVEIHYYTLWERDCGRISHPLDVEHASTLVTKTSGMEWQALYWYAGAHEKTACDISSGAHASAIDAQTRGPRIWASKGKHALYFDDKMCNRGCGSDSCKGNVELAQSGPIINIGERNGPSNGSDWSASPKWVLRDKMDTDFTPEVMTRLEQLSGSAIATVRGRSSVRGTIQGSDSVLGGAVSGAQHTGAAVQTANGHTSRSLNKATKASGNFLSRTWRALFNRKKPSDSPR